MKKLGIFILGAALLTACNTDAPEQEDDSLLNSTPTATEEVSEEAPSENDNAVCLYTTWLKAELKKDSKANKKVQFGSVLEVLDTASLDNKHYSQVKVVDGTVGWIKTYLIATKAERAITTKELSLYKEADILALSDTKIPAGTMIAVEKEEIAGYIYIIGAERKIKGYIKDQKGISSSDLNLEVGMLRQKALSLEGQAKLDAVKAIIDNEDYIGSAFYGELKDMLPVEIDDVQIQQEELIEETIDAIEEEL